jgi:hypothetical protein
MLCTGPESRSSHGLIAALAIALMVCGHESVHAADNAAVKRTIASASAYLRTIQKDLGAGRDSLAAYALLKADGKATEAENAAVIAGILDRAEGSEFKPSSSHEGIYSSGIEAMILSDVDPEKYKPQIQKIANYLIAEQLPNGGFDYRGAESTGDTSVTQYAALGLWAAARAGVEIPPEVWDKLALWHLSVQEKDGGFAYVPGRATGVTGASTNGTMSAAAAASMTICAMYLHPEKMQAASGLTDGLQAQAQKPSTPTRDPNNPLGVLTVRDPDASRPDAPTGPYKPTASFDAIMGSARRAVGFVTANFNVKYYRDGWRHYHYYTIERMAALLDLDQLGSHDWFDECANELIQTQLPDGSWRMPGMEAGNNNCVATSFAVLFLTRSTAKLLNRTPPPDPIGGGLQVGGRGLPDDLASVTMQDGRVAKDESLGPLDDLLKSLEAAAGDDLFNLQTQIVKKIQLGDRSELIGQTDRLVDLLDYPGPDIRRTALWALARSDDLSMARHMVAALEDPDRDVLIEAHNALCWLSRRPNAFDIPPDPLAGLPPDATDEQKEQAVAKWRASALKQWGNWYLKMCSYEERNTPFAHDLARKIGLR